MNAADDVTDDAAAGSPRRVVIFGHAADRTGPPIYLLQLLRHLDRDGLDVRVVLLRGGELLAELRELVDVRVVGEPVDPAVASAWRMEDERRRVAVRRAALADLADVDLVVINTAWSVHALDWLPEAPRRVLSVVHELEAGVSDLLAPAQLEALLGSDRFLVGCRAVRSMLVERHGVDPADIMLVPYGVELDVAEAEPAGGGDPDADRDRDVRAALGVRGDEYLIVDAAVPDRRKGPDLFVHLAAAARRRRPDIAWAFRWIGATQDDPRLDDAIADRGLFGVDDLVRFVPPTPKLRAYLASADAFVLASREDAFPLAAVEAALAGLPLMCFDTGGMTDLVRDDAGVIVRFADVDAMVDQLAQWHDDPSGRLAAGAAASARARRDHDVRDHARAFRGVVDSVLGIPGCPR